MERKTKNSPAKQRREREHETHRLSILAAAERVFAEKGFADASIAEIAHEAQFSVGSIYNFFHGKKELGEAVVLNIVKERVDDMRALRDAGFKTAREAHAAFAKMWVYHHAAHDAFMRMGIAYQNSKGRGKPPAEILDQFKLYEKAGVAFFAECRKLPGYRGMSAEDFFNAAEGLCHHMLFKWHRSGEKDTSDFESEVSRFLTEFFTV